MTTQFNTKSPTIRRILREAAELSSSPSPDYHAAPLDTNLFEWHFTLRGPPSPSPFSTGIYHGRIVLPPTYPLRPPSFRFLTPSGRFEVNREICLSISGFHEESWQPAWGVRTAIVALRAFMTEGGKGQVGGLESSEGVRRLLAGESARWRCNGCGGRSNEEVLKEQEELARAMEGKKEEEKVPEQLKLGYREDIERKGDAAETAGGGDGNGDGDGDAKKKDVLDDTKVLASILTSAPLSSLPPDSAQGAAHTQRPQPPTSPTPPQQAPPAPHPQPATLPSTQTLPESSILTQTQTPRPNSITSSDSTSWVDYAIVGIVIMLIIMIMKKLLAFEGL